MTETLQIRTDVSPISGFWRRLLAFFLDTLALGIVGIIIGFFLYDFLASIGGWGRFFGFAIAFTYFGVMNSRLCYGTTLGKAIMKIRVVSSSGEPLSVAAAFCRSGIICVPYFLNGAPFDVQTMNSWFVVVLVVLIFGVGLSIVYLFIFNRKTRQSLHDLAVGSYVIRAGGEVVALPAVGMWRGHTAVVALLLIIAAVAPVFTGQLAKKEPFVSLLPLHEALSNEPGVRYAAVVVGVNLSASPQQGAKFTNHLSIRVVTDLKDVNRDLLANKIARVAFSRFPDTGKKDVVAVSIAYGYDIGIAASWQTQSFAFSPEQWQVRLTPKSGERS